MLDNSATRPEAGDAHDWSKRMRSTESFMEILAPALKSSLLEFHVLVDQDVFGRLGDRNTAVLKEEQYAISKYLEVSLCSAC